MPTQVYYSEIVNLIYIKGNAGSLHGNRYCPAGINEICLSSLSSCLPTLNTDVAPAHCGLLSGLQECRQISVHDWSGLRPRTLPYPLQLAA